jgi:hypothetical protein
VLCIEGLMQYAQILGQPLWLHLCSTRTGAVRAGPVWDPERGRVVAVEFFRDIWLEVRGHRDLFDDGRGRMGIEWGLAAHVPGLEHYECLASDEVERSQRHQEMRRRLAEMLAERLALEPSFRLDTGDLGGIELIMIFRGMQEVLPRTSKLLQEFVELDMSSSSGRRRAAEIIESLKELVPYGYDPDGPWGVGWGTPGLMI